MLLIHLFFDMFLSLHSSLLVGVTSIGVSDTGVTLEGLLIIQSIPWKSSRSVRNIPSLMCILVSCYPGLSRQWVWTFDT